MNPPDLKDSQNEFHGKLQDASVSPAFEPGIIGDAVLIRNGVGIGIESSPEEFGFENKSFSVSCWCRLDSWYDGDFIPHYLLSQGEGRAWYLAAKVTADVNVNAQGWRFNVAQSGSSGPLLPGTSEVAWPVQDRTWHHIVCVYVSKGGNYGADDPSRPCVFIDGEKRAWRSYSVFSINNNTIPTGVRRITKVPEEGAGLSIGSVGNVPMNQLAWRGVIDDMAIWERALTDSEVRAIYLAASKENKPIRDILSPDTDLDGMPDSWEIKHGLDPEIADDANDLDNDGLVNAQEYQRGTDPNVEDTDEDGYSDRVETHTGRWMNEEDTGSNPVQADSDGDALLDGEENLALPNGSDPNRVDTDGDGLDDHVERDYQSDPASAESLPEMDQGLLAYWPLDEGADDYLGIYDGQERGAEALPYEKGRFGQGALFNGSDTAIEIVGGDEQDFDFVGESFAMSLWIRIDTHPLLEECERCFPLYGLLSKGFFDSGPALYISNERLNFSRIGLAGAELPVGDGVLHHVLTNVDGRKGTAQIYFDGVLIKTGTAEIVDTSKRLWVGAHEGPAGDAGDLIHFAGLIDDVAIWRRPLAPKEIERIFREGGSIKDLAQLDDPVANGDLDGDGLPDEWENRFGLDVAVNDAAVDHDRDGLSNLREFESGTEPKNADTDGDGLLDGVESKSGVWLNKQNSGTDPLESDTDGDGLADGIENPDQPYAAGISVGSDPNAIDTDNDGLTDDVEWEYGSDPSMATSHPSGSHGLVAYWPLDRSLIDLGGRARDGESQGPSEITFETGQFGEGAYFRGDQSIAIVGGTESDFNFTNKSFAISLWFRADSLLAECEGGCSQELVLLSKGQSPGNLRVELRENKLVFAYAAMESSIAIDDGAFHHLIALVDAGRDATELYLDGELVATSHLRIFDTSDNRLHLGAHPPREGASSDIVNWTGLLDDIAVWDRPLSYQEIRDLGESGQSIGQRADLEPTEIDPSIDTDGDGSPDAAEFLARTDAHDPQSRLYVIGMERIGEDLRIRWKSTPTTPYLLEYSPDGSLDQWEVLPEVIESQGDVTEIIDRDSERTGNSGGYYRIRVSSEKLAR